MASRKLLPVMAILAAFAISAIPVASATAIHAIKGPVAPTLNVIKHRKPHHRRHKHRRHHRKVGSAVPAPAKL
jgi:hypothetical protein